MRRFAKAGPLVSEVEPGGGSGRDFAESRSPEPAGLLRWFLLSFVHHEMVTIQANYQ
jgi:hypothetical protein